MRRKVQVVRRDNALKSKIRVVVVVVAIFMPM